MTVHEETKNTYGKKLWRIQNLYKIRDKNRRLGLLKLNNIQKKIVGDIQADIRAGRPVRHFTLKARQQGVSTFWMLWWLDDTITKQNTITGVLAHKWDNVKMVMEIARLAYQNLPPRWRPRLGDNTKQAMTFPDLNSKFFSGLSIRSTAVHNLHISEWCFCDDEEVRATLAASSERTNISGESTGNGVGNDGYTTYQSAAVGENEYKARFFPWFLQEEYRADLLGQDAGAILKGLTRKERVLQELMRKDYGLELEAGQVLWRRKMEMKLKAMFGQEYPETAEDAFRTAGSKFFEYKKINRLVLAAKAHLKENPPVAQDDDWVQFEKPSKGDVYVAGADPAEGGGDYCVLKIINVTKRREAFVFRAKCGIDAFYRACDKWGRLYWNALMAVERNNHGHAVLLGLAQGCGYPNIFKEQTGETWAVGDTFPKEKPGWLTTSNNRVMMLDCLKEGLEGLSVEDEDHFRPELLWLDQFLLKECLCFEEVEGKYQAVEGEHDDDVMASSIAFQMYLKARKSAAQGASSASSIYVGAPREAR